VDDTVRTSAIAARAGVNKQLISHHFGGKDGLYAALVARWEADEAAYGVPDTSFFRTDVSKSAAPVRRGDATNASGTRVGADVTKEAST
jgi:AcrR family transcriptional regulator